MPRKTATERKAPPPKFAPGDIACSWFGDIVVIVRVMPPAWSLKPGRQSRKYFRHKYKTCLYESRKFYYDFETHLTPMIWTFHGPVRVR